MLTSAVLTVRCTGPGLSVPNQKALQRLGVGFRFVSNRNNIKSPVECMNVLLNNSTEDILIYTHDDLTIYDSSWHSRLMSCFSDDVKNYLDTIAVGFGGALGLGHPDLYKRPYNMQDMARQNYFSNQTDAEVHGKRFEGISQVAVLDAFIMAVRRDFLLSIGGWPQSHLTHHCSDLWLACEAAKADKQIYMTGVSCTHHGGGTSTKGVYKSAKWLQGGSLDSDHQEPHRWLYENYRDVLPINV